MELQLNQLRMVILLNCNKTRADNKKEDTGAIKEKEEVMVEAPEGTESTTMRKENHTKNQLSSPNTKKINRHNKGTTTLH
jgi:hypothetical protein